MSDMFPEEDECKFKDPLDQGSYMAQKHNEHSIAAVRLKSAPEQDGTITECCDCGGDIEPQRVKIFRKRCYECQVQLENRGRHGLG